MTPAQLLRLAAQLIAFLRKKPMTANPLEHGSLAQGYTTEPLSHPHQPQIPAANPVHSWIGVSLDEDLYEKLNALAREKNLTLEELIRHAVKEFLNRTKPA